ncbi:hypothetical protein [Botrimarina hoheduenensis]|uniref:Uncharacterized protein n=1 Tax=Botrimarina hoheduenensis TaxID=2528000 RepID=A0A5C5W8C1_9BACT|nr:hypothetical protein [Botrimarina hoheduenensis]TWT46844.1 hypothetical protein Pla111_19460 [Botrimarina hoheduenensis]
MASSTPTPIAGVHPAGLREATIATVWPSIAAGGWGRWLGRLYALRAGVSLGGVPITVGWLLVVVTTPLAGLLYLAKKVPRKPLVVFGARNPHAVCYRVTNRRILILAPLERDTAPDAALSHADYDEIAIEVLPGQAWFHAADVVFLHHGTERLRLAGVPRPEPFRELCRKTQRAAAIVPAAVPVPTKLNPLRPSSGGPTPTLSTS